MIGKITGLEIGKNKDSELDVVLLQVQITEENDIQTIQLESSNLEIIPEINDFVYINKVNDSFKIANIYETKINSDGSLTNGEARLIAKQDGAIKSFIICRVNGDVELNGNADFACRFNALETMVNDLNSKFDSHLHPHGEPNTGPPNSSLNLDPSGIKVDTVRMP